MSAHEWQLVPVVDMEQILVPWQECLRVPLGPVTFDLVHEMQERDFDYAPVFSTAEPSAAVLGLISRQRLANLAKGGQELSEDDEGIVFLEYDEIWVKTSLSMLLGKMVERPAWMVVHEGDAEQYGPIFKTYGLVTRSDLNKHPVRVIIYEILAKLEMALAAVVRRHFNDPFDWIRQLSEENQARILGYWEVAKLKGVDAGPVAVTTLNDLLNVTAKDRGLYSIFGYGSRSAFEKALGGIRNIRNQTMHPVRPLITDADSCTSLKRTLGNALTLTTRAEGKLAHTRDVQST